MINDTKIRQLAEQNSLLHPFCMDNLQPHSYDVTLGDFIALPQYNHFTEERSWIKKGTIIPYKLQPLHFALGSTKETFKLPSDIVGVLCGKSTLARNGLVIESAGLIDQGFHGELTLEFFSQAPWPISLESGMRIGQVYFFEVDSPHYKFYKEIGNYNGQSGPTEPKYNI